MKEVISGLGMVIANAWSKIPAINEALSSIDNTPLYLILGIICTFFTLFGAVYLLVVLFRFFFVKSQMEKNGEEGKPWKMLISGTIVGCISILFPWFCSLIGIIVGLFY